MVECRLSTVQLRKSPDTVQLRKKVRERSNIRRPSALTNMLSNWKNSRLKEKSQSILHWAVLTFSASSTQWDVKNWMSKARNLSAMTLESCAWMTGQRKLPGKSSMTPTGSTPSQKSTHTSQSSWWSLLGLKGIGRSVINQGYHPLREDP